jgi:enolase
MDIAMDPAASEFYDAKLKKYNLSAKAGTTDRLMSDDQMIAIYTKLTEKYPIVSIEDPFDQDDFAAYVKMTKKLGNKIQVVGDDLLVTNPTRIKVGIEKKLVNALLLKVN